MSVPRFWREIPQRYNLLASECGNCNQVHFPPREVCPECRRASIGKMKQRRLSGRGIVKQWTQVHKPAAGYEKHVPYVLALIEAEEGPVMTGQIADGQKVQVGQPVKAVFRRLGSDGEDGVIYYGTKWIAEPTAIEYEEEE